MKKLFTLLALLVFVAACNEYPTQPTNTDTDDDQNQSTTVIINIPVGGGDDDDKDDDGGPPAGNTAPFVINPGTQTNSVGDNVNLPITASDAEGDDLDFTWVVNTAPRNLGLTKTGPNSAIISGTISSSSSEDSPFNTTIIVRDPDGLSSSTTFLWIVNAVEEEL
jgi:hypothetical protein